jgi:ABC-type nitrate/sulfonate/bicarbonate transport system substrate-binding protein
VVDAALLTTPFNFFAETEGYRNLGFTFDYLPKMPFAGMAVNRDWALKNATLVQRFLDAYDKGVAWFYDPQNREAAIALQLQTSKIAKDDVEKAYAFLHDKNLFERSGEVSKASVDQVIGALRDLGDLDPQFTMDRLLLPGITRVVD